jgi:outer membrane protein assembly factor BamB
MKRSMLVSLVLLGAFALSACGTSTSTSSWPGLAADASQAYLANGSFLYAVRLTDGAKVWQYPDKAGTQHFYSNPVVTSAGQVLVGSSGVDNGLASLDAATGSAKWAAPFTASDRWVAPPLVVGDAVYAANNNGTLYVLSLASGLQQWSMPLGGQMWAAPVTNGKLVFVPSLDHFLYAVDPSARKVAWKLDLGGAAPSSAAISPDGASLYVGSFAKKVFGVDAASGAVRWTAPTEDWVWSSPVLDGDTLYVADLSGNLYSLGAPNGKNAWPDLQPDGPITGSPTALSNGMLVATESGTAVAFDRTGNKTWDVTVGGTIYTTPVAAGTTIAIAPLNSDYLLAGVSPDGKVLWKFTGK